MERILLHKMKEEGGGRGIMLKRRKDKSMRERGYEGSNSWLIEEG